MIGRVNTGSGGTGAALTVTAPAGSTVTVSKDGKSKTKVADAFGVAVFKGLSTGDWTVTITDGEQEAQKTVTITADYAAAITFFSATIHVTYPAGSKCTATDGVTTLTAPDTSGVWECVVPNAGTWTVSLNSGYKETVTVNSNGEIHTVNKWYLYNLGDRSYITGGWSSYYSEGQGISGIENDHLFLDGGKGYEASILTKNKINTSNFSTIKFQYTIPSSRGKSDDVIYFGLSNTASIFPSFISSWSESSPPVVNTKTTASVSLDTSNLNAYCGASFRYSGRVHIFAIWMEA